MTTTTPSFSWYPSIGATSFNLLVQNTSGVALYMNFNAATACGGGSCYVTPNVALAKGTTYNWFVNAANADGVSPWSTGVSMSVPFIPDAPTLISPNGAVSTDHPTFTWTAATYATRYNFSLNVGASYSSGWYNATDLGCASGTGTCSLVLLAPLSAGYTYEWYVNAGNDGGNSPPSQKFTVRVGAMPVTPPTTYSPTGTITATRPMFSWQAVSGATSYYLLVQNTAGVVIGETFTPQQAGCTSATQLTCSVQTAGSLPGGTFAWYINASGDGLTSAWSAARMITVNTPAGERFPANCMAPLAADGWSTPAGASAGWSVSTDFTSEGACSLKSNAIGDNGKAQVEFRGWFNAGSLAFDRRVSSEYNVDCLRFFFDGVEQNVGGTCIARGALSVGGEVPWGTSSWTIPAGFHTLTWSYEKNGSLSSGADAAWIDNLVMPLQAPVAAPPAAPVGIRPDGVVSGSAPLFKWTAVPGATSYRLQAQNTSGVAFSTVYTAAEVNCAAAAECSVIPATALPTPGLYNWFVQAANGYGFGAWSDARMLKYDDAASAGGFPAGCAVPTTGWTNGIPFNELGWQAGTDFASDGLCSLRTPPMPNQFGSLRARIGYTGTFSAGTVRFDRKLSSTAGVACLHVLVDGAYQAIGGSCGMGPGMSGESSWVQVSVPITAGTHTIEWFFEKSLLGSATDAAWIDNVVLPVPLPAPGLPNAPVLVSPTGTVATLNPTYTWNAIPGSTSYYLLAQNTAGVAVGVSVTPAAAGCATGTGTCSFTPGASLANGSVYNWFVNASNGVGTGPWSAATTISVSVAGPSIPGAPVPIAPMGTVGTVTPTYSWAAIAGASSYYLLAQNTSGVAVSMSVSPAAAGCGSGTGTCSIVPPGSLGNGAVYNWFVNATNNLGTGPWSAATTITVSATGPSAPPAPLLISPWAGMLATNMPNYYWMASSGATSYYLLVQNTAGVRVGVSLAASSVCAAGECSYTPATALASGTTYNWFVNATNSLGTSPWSEGRTITAP